MEIAIRKMKPSDLEQAIAVLENWNMAPRPEEPDAERSGIEVDHAFVALDGNRVIGMASYLLLSEKEAETASLAVDPDYKGQGIGYRLQVARLSEMRARGIERVHTETDRPETIRWYIEKFGYRKVGANLKKHDFSLSDVDHWTVLELDLSKVAWREEN
ncbi:MAG: GNAT family N-acetyltransferase [Deltaproteobacteria bacterium]|nr:GNAT family N-acetyltransferase [Deltaproteobacteria bacterium]